MNTDTRPCFRLYYNHPVASWYGRMQRLTVTFHHDSKLASRDSQFVENENIDSSKISVLGAKER